MSYTGEEKRKNPRIDVSFVVSYRPLDEEELADLSQTRNFSQGGMLLTTNTAFKKGTFLKMFIRLPLITDKIHLLGKVLESKQVVKNLIYETRIVFQNLEDEVNRVLKDTVDSFMEEGKK